MDYIYIIITLMTMTGLTSHAASIQTPGRHLVCRDRLGLFYVDHFKVSACSMCYFYMIKEDPRFILDRQVKFLDLHSSPYNLIENGSSDLRKSVRVFPSYDNQTSLDVVCDTLDERSCERWTSCCKAAWDCCRRQQTVSRDMAIHHNELGLVNYCPMTFDGWLCWDSTQAGTTVHQGCPNFLIEDEVSGQSVKHCMDDGHWQTDNISGLEYTDYEACKATDDNQLYRWTIAVGVVLNCLGLLLSVPSIAIFSLNRGLYKQQRIQIHINLFMSLVLSASTSLVWDLAVRLDRISFTQEQSTLYTEQGLCKSLHVLYKWGRATTFFWMTCEGYFLHRLVVNAFLPPKHFHGYLIFGWVIPSVLFVTYGVTRKFLADDSMCWLLPLEGTTKAVEWVLVYSPPILCITINTVFLFNILKQLLTKMSTHPNEPSTFRKAVKATFILIPLFGLDQFCLIYRPSPERVTEFYIYEFASAIILNSQGIIIALVFCYFNNEVRGYIKQNVSRLKRKYYDKKERRANRKASVSTKSDSRKTSISSLQIYTSGLLQNGRQAETNFQITNSGRPTVEQTQFQNGTPTEGITNDGFSRSDASEITYL